MPSTLPRSYRTPPLHSCPTVLAFTNISDTTDFAAAGAADLHAVETIGAALDGSDKPFVVTSATLLVAIGAAISGATPGRPATEQDTALAGVPRGASGHAAIALAERDVRPLVIPLPPSVQSEGDTRGLVSTPIGIARATGVSAFVDDGANRRPAVHRLDAALLYRLAVEAAPAGSRLHGAGEEGVPFPDIVAVIGQHLILPAVSLSHDDAGAHFGFLFPFVSIDNPTSSTQTQELLGWRPEHTTLIPDIEAGHYFHNPSA